MYRAAKCAPLFGAQMISERGGIFLVLHILLVLHSCPKKRRILCNIYRSAATSLLPETLHMFMGYYKIIINILSILLVVLFIRLYKISTCEFWINNSKLFSIQTFFLYIHFFIFVVYRPTVEFSTVLPISPLQGAYGPLSSDGSFFGHTYCDTGHWFHSLIRKTLELRTFQRRCSQRSPYNRYNR